MHILILNWRDTKHPLGGGAEIALFEHALYWKKKGAKVTWFTSSFNGSTLEEDINGIQFIRRGSQFTVHLHAFLYVLKNKLVSSIDVVIDNFHFIPFFSLFYIPKKKIIALIHEPAKQNWFKNINIFIASIGYFSEPLFFQVYKNIPFITGSHSIAKELEEYHIDKKNIFVIPHGIQLSKKTRDNAKTSIPSLLFLGQLTRDKGIEDAITMMKYLTQKNKRIILYVAGKTIDEQYKKQLQGKILNLQLGNNIKFLGFVSENKKYALLKKSWILIHPSYREGWGLNVIEAAAQGTPTVGYNVTGLQDSIQDKKTGLLTRQNTPHELAQQVELLLEDKILYNKLSNNALKFSQQFRWDFAGERSWNLIKKIYGK